jgi:hypothetical protein
MSTPTKAAIAAREQLLVYLRDAFGLHIKSGFVKLDSIIQSAIEQATSYRDTVRLDFIEATKGGHDMGFVWPPGKSLRQALDTAMEDRAKRFNEEIEKRFRAAQPQRDLRTIVKPNLDTPL